MLEQTSISDKVFGKALEQLSLADVEKFFAEEQEENDYLEFKSYRDSKPTDVHIDAVTRTVAAFLNSAGGIVIWGAPALDKNTKKYKGSLTQCPLMEKDSLVYKISNKITPLPNAVKIQILPLNTGAVYVIEVKASIYAPHQYNGQYPMRLDGQSIAAPHHYVDALFKRVEVPELEGYIKLNETSFNTRIQAYTLSIEVLLFNWSPNINEESLFYLLETLYYSHTSNDILKLDNHIERLKIMPAFPSGIPYIEKQTLLIKYHEINSHLKNQIKIRLRFGGKKSPLKASMYTAYVESDYKKSYITPDFENLLVTETLNLNNGISREDIKKLHLGR